MSCTVSVAQEPRARSLFSLPPPAGLWPHGVPAAPSCFPMLTVPCSAGLVGRFLRRGSVPRPAWFVAWPCGERAGSAVGGEPPSWLSPLPRFTRRFPSLAWLVLRYGPGARQHPLAGGLRTSGADCGQDPCDAPQPVSLPPPPHVRCTHFQVKTWSLLEYSGPPQALALPLPLHPLLPLPGDWVLPSGAAG